MNRRIKKKKLKQKEEALRKENLVLLPEALTVIAKAIPRIIEAYCRICETVLEFVKNIDWNSVLNEYTRKRLEENNEQKTEDNQPS